MKDQAWIQARLQAVEASRDQLKAQLEQGRANLAAHNGAVEILKELLADDPPAESKGETP